MIAAKDAEGKILWSWHIWMTDLPMGQVYWRNAGTMMDRNLGALSATPGVPDEFIKPTNFDNCFLGCSKLGDCQYIPNDWK